jgi:hypothetical protein
MAAGSENAAVPSAVAGSQVAAVAGSQADAVAVTGCQTAAVQWQVLKLQQQWTANNNLLNNTVWQQTHGQIKPRHDIIQE